MEDEKRLVPYSMTEPGFEAMYTGEKSAPLNEEVAGNAFRITDESGNVITKWSTWPWTWPGQEKNWADETKYINEMQIQLGPLGDDVRRIRGHIGSLVLCDSGIPVTIDELLCAIGSGKLTMPAFHNGCWCCHWGGRSTQPFQEVSMQAIYEVLMDYLGEKPKEELVERFPYASGFIRRSYKWLGPVTELTKLQKLMMDRMLLPFDFFTGHITDYATVNENCFEEGGRGVQLDAEISALAGLPKIYMDHLLEYRENLSKISDPQKKDLYRICCHIAHGVHGLSDCHHNAFRYIESWIHGIGTGEFEVRSRRRGAERERLGRLVFGYVLGLDRWLLEVPLQLLLLDLGHIDLGFNPGNEIRRVYAYLDEKTPVKEWLAACLWHILSTSPHGGLHRHKDVLESAAQAGIGTRGWIEQTLAK